MIMAWPKTKFNITLVDTKPEFGLTPPPPQISKTEQTDRVQLEARRCIENLSRRRAFQAFEVQVAVGSHQ